MEFRLKADLSAPTSFIKDKVFYCLIRVIMLYMVSAMTKSLWVKFLPLNHILGTTVFILVITIYFISFNKRDLFIIIPSIALILSGFFMTYDLSIHLKSSVYWLITIMFLWKLQNEEIARELYKEIIKANRFILVVVIIADILLCIGMIVPSGYLENFMGKYFVGFSIAPHSLGAVVCLLLISILALIESKKSKKLWFLLLLPGIYAIFNSGARIFLISLLIVIAIVYFNFIESRKHQLIILPFAAIVFTVFVVGSGMMDKFDFVIGNKFISSDLIAQLSSGRAEFWLIDIRAYMDYDILSKLFGKGFDEIYLINLENYGLRIWGHNDIIDLLLGTGLCGVTLYMTVIGVNILCIFKNTKNRLSAVLLVAYLLIPMLLNGFYPFQTYVYSYVILFLLMRIGYNNPGSLDKGLLQS